MKHVCKKPAKHLRPALEFLHGLGGEVDPIRQGKSHRLAWRYRGKAFTVWVAICRHGWSMAEEVVRAVAQAMQRAGFAVPARAGAVS